ncbi:serine/threonine-protein kinase dst2-like isoform X2 [Argopecten irradians]|uniref:serine/threonine-protein kinase dst2-like isoform X2 n=1 Tax=Argopecten irradians TaxID=31199 RepID=UPI00371FBE3B
MAHRSNQSTTRSLYAKEQSIISYVEKYVTPQIMKWEKEMKEVRRRMKKMNEIEKAQVFFKMLSIIAHEVTTLQKSCGYRFYDVPGRYLDELAPNVPKDMEKKLAIWKQQAQTIKSPEHLEQLFNIFQCQLQSWTLKHTEMFSGSQQTQQQVDFPEHQRNDGQIPTEISKGGTVESTQTTQDGRNKILQEKNEKLQKMVSELQMKYDSKAAENLERNKEEENLKAEIEQLRKTSNEQRKQVKAKERENNELLTRLSAVAGHQQQENDPAIADLSSDIRPTKIAEQFKKIYDNKWDDAFEELRNQGFPDEKAILILRTTVEESFKFTAGMAKWRLQTLEACALSLPFHNEEEAENGWQVDKSQTLSEGCAEKDRIPDRSERQKHVEPVALSEECKDLVKQLRKASAQTKTHVEEIQNCFIVRQENKHPHEKKKVMIDFYKECAKVTWYMNLQTPPLSLAPIPAKGNQISSDLCMYIPRTVSGNTVDYVVWPACLLHEGGPLLTKGVIRPFQKHK